MSQANTIGDHFYLVLHPYFVALEEVHIVSKVVVACKLVM